MTVCRQLRPMMMRRTNRIWLMALLTCWAPLLAACGDSDGQRSDPTPTVAITVTPVPTAMQTPTGTPDDSALRCLQSGGTVATRLCCEAGGEFPGTCGLGACGCSPSESRSVRICECGPTRCYNVQSGCRVR